MKKLILFSVVAAFAAVACNKTMDVPGGPEASFDDSMIAFTTRMPEAAQTRATEVTTNTLTSFNVVAVSGTATQTLVWNDGVFTGTAGGDFTGGKYWPSESVSWNFYASNSALNFNASGTTLTVNDCNTDVVAEYLEGAVYKQKNALTFDHVLCQLGTIQMKAPETYTVSDLKVTIQPIVSGTYDLKADSWTRGSASAAVYVVGSANAGVSVPSTGDGYVSADNDLWLLPGQYTLTTTYTISKGDYSNSFQKTATVTLVQGKNNNLRLPDTDNDGNHDDPNIPVPDDISEIVFTVSVTPWSDNDIDAVFN